MQGRMHLQRSFLDIFNPVINNPMTTQKSEKALLKLLSRMEFEAFIQQFLLGLDISFRSPISNQNGSVDRFLNFMAGFIVSVITKHEYQAREHDYTSQAFEAHPILSRVISEVLKYNNLDYEQARYHCCKFIRLILKHLGNDIQLDDHLCDKIQKAMIMRAEDHKSQIRRQAILALVRLQDPVSECPVVKTFLDKFTDPNSLVRKEVVLNVAINPTTMLRIIERLRDVEPSVRNAAYYKCSQFGPKYLRITDRQEVLLNGFSEQNATVKKMFLETLLPKWLNFYEGNILKLLQAIKLDADENDVKRTVMLIEKLLDVYFRTKPLKDVLETLSLQNKLIPIEKLNTENVTYWLCLYIYVQKTEDVFEYLEEICPDLTQMCNYLESFIKAKESKRMELWEKLEYEQILYSLFKMVRHFDFSDEVGRKAFLNLAKDLLLYYKFEHKVLMEIMKILYKIYGNTLKLSEEICDVISQIREQEFDDASKVAIERRAEEEYKMAQLRIEMVSLGEKLEDAIQSQDWTLASSFQDKIKEIKLLLNTDTIMSSQTSRSGSVKELGTDSEVISRCLDILIALLSVPQLVNLEGPIKIIKGELVDPFITSEESDLYWRVFRCNILYSLLDINIAKDSIKLLISPILAYRITTVYLRPVLFTSLNGFSDMLRLYGLSILPKDEEAEKSFTSKRRKLYHMENQIEGMDETKLYSFEQIVEAILDMLDDSKEELREVAGNCIANLLVDKHIKSPSLITRLLLKWFNPNTEKQDPKISQILGKSFFKRAQDSKPESNVFLEAVIPTLETISSAPKKSPFYDINIDKVIQVLTNLITIGTGENAVPITVHKNICQKIERCVHEKSAYVLSKLLLSLDVKNDDLGELKNLSTLNEQVLMNMKDKSVIRNLTKFKTKISEKISVHEHVELESESTSVSGSYNFTDDDSSRQESSSNFSEQRLPSISDEIEDPVETNKSLERSLDISTQKKRNGITSEVSVNISQLNVLNSARKRKLLPIREPSKEKETLYKRVLRKNKRKSEKTSETDGQIKPAKRRKVDTAQSSELVELRLRPENHNNKNKTDSRIKDNNNSLASEEHRYSNRRQRINNKTEDEENNVRKSRRCVKLSEKMIDYCKTTKRKGIKTSPLRADKLLLEENSNVRILRSNPRKRRITREYNNKVESVKNCVLNSSRTESCKRKRNESTSSGTRRRNLNEATNFCQSNENNDENTSSDIDPYSTNYGMEDLVKINKVDTMLLKRIICCEDFVHKVTSLNSDSPRKTRKK